MLLSLTVTAAMYAFAAALVEGPRGASRSRFLPYVFGAAVAASFMVKWIFGPAFIEVVLARLRSGKGGNPDA